MLKNTKRYIKLLRRYNRLENEYTILVDQVKDDIFMKTLEKLGEPLEFKRLKAENIMLRSKNHELKDELKKVNSTE